MWLLISTNIEADFCLFPIATLPKTTPFLLELPLCPPHVAPKLTDNRADLYICPNAILPKSTYFALSHVSAICHPHVTIDLAAIEADHCLITYATFPENHVLLTVSHTTDSLDWMRFLSSSDS